MAGFRVDSIQAGLLLTLLGRAAVIICGGLVSILLARHYGADTYGEWSAASVYGMMVSVVVEGGLGNMLMRDASRDKDAAASALGLVLRGRVFLGTVVVPIVLAVAFGLGNGGGRFILIAILVSVRFIEGIQGSFHALLVSLGFYRFTNMMEVVRRVTLLAVIAGIVLVDLRIMWAALGSVLVVGVTTAIEFNVVRRAIGVRWDRPVGAAWKDAAWFWAAGVFFWVNGEFNQLLLSNMAGDHETGLYAAAYRLSAFAMLIPQVAAYNVVPRMFKSFSDEATHERQMNTSALLLAALGALIAVEVLLAGPEVLDLVYGGKYGAAAPAFQALGFYLLFFYLRAPPSWHLFTTDRVPTIAIYLFAGCVANVAANLVLIPRYGATGSAYATVASEGLILLLAVGSAIKTRGMRPVLSAIAGLSAGALAWPLHLALASLLPWYAVSALVGAGLMGGLYFVAKRIQAGWDAFGLLSPRLTAKAT